MLSVLAVGKWLAENGRKHLGNWVVLRGDELNETVCSVVGSHEELRMIRDGIRDGDLVMRIPRDWVDRLVNITLPEAVFPGPFLTRDELDRQFPPGLEGADQFTIRMDGEAIVTNTAAPVRTLPDPIEAELEPDIAPGHHWEELSDGTRTLRADDVPDDVDPDDTLDEEPVVDEPSPAPKAASRKKK